MVKNEKRDKFWNKGESEVKEHNLDSLFKLSKDKGVNWYYNVGDKSFKELYRGNIDFKFSLNCASEEHDGKSVPWIITYFVDNDDTKSAIRLYKKLKDRFEDL